MGGQWTVIAGPNRSGKTTLAQEYLLLHPGLYLGADAIAEELSPGSPERAQVRAGRRFLIGVEEALHANHSLVIESRGSGRSFGHIVEMARQREFVITMVFLFLDSADTSIGSGQAAETKGGHDDPSLTFVVGFIAACGTSGASITSWPTTGPWSAMLGAIFRTWHLVPERLFRSATRHLDFRICIIARPAHNQKERTMSHTHLSHIQIASGSGSLTARLPPSQTRPTPPPASAGRTPGRSAAVEPESA